MKVKSSWLAGLDEQQAKELKANLLGSEIAMKRLKALLFKRLEQNYTEQRAKTTYDDPNWACKQADHIGAQRTYKEIMDLIDFW